ncbi:MAG: hypothetical protein WCB11_16245 [Terriglobales bacterium]
MYSKFLSEVLITALSLALATPAPAKDLQSVAGEATVAVVVGSVAWHDYIFLGLSLLGVFGLAHSWVWWLRIGRHQPTKRSRAAMALVYNTALPLLLMGLLPRCFVPRSYALIGLPLAALGCAIAHGKLRLFLATCALVWYLIFAASIPVFRAGSRPTLTQNRQSGCESGGQ